MPLHPFERTLLVPSEMIGFGLRGHPLLPWDDFWMNPRRLRGADFLMRWEQGEWSEKRLVEAVDRTDAFSCHPYGPSGVAPSDPREYELYFEKLEKAGIGELKRPDLLVFPRSNAPAATSLIHSLGGATELPFVKESDPRMAKLLSLACLAIECENSLWEAKKMPHYRLPLTPQKRMNGKLGMSKSAVLPTVIIKEQDLSPLLDWQEMRGVPIHVWHSFFDLAFGISLDDASKLIKDGMILGTTQTFQAPNGATTTKILYKVYHHHAYELGESVEPPTLRAEAISDKNGHILPYVTFEGGRLDLRPTALNVLHKSVR